MTDCFPAQFLAADLRSDPGLFSAAYRTGWRTGSFEEPNRHFDSRWYALHNSDWHFVASPFDHYLRVGLAQGRDPSPYVDFQRLSSCSRGVDNRHVYARLIADGAGPSMGVYPAVSVLRDVQQQFRDCIKPFVMRPRLTARRDHLVFVQNSSSSRVAEWAAHAGRTYDILSNHFDTASIGSSRSADMRVFQVGTKFTAIAQLARDHRELLQGYRYVLLIDDDIAITATQLDRAFAECVELGASLAQPAVTADSECAWPDLFHEAVHPGPLRVNTVEVMMPIFSGGFFDRVLDTFSLSISGFGLDLLWGARLDASEAAFRLGTVTARHERPIDRDGGAYYRFLRDNHINPRAELWSLVTEFGLRRSIRRWAT